jgi:hypothetical protein
LWEGFACQDSLLEVAIASLNVAVSRDYFPFSDVDEVAGAQMAGGKGFFGAVGHKAGRYGRSQR